MGFNLELTTDTLPTTLSVSNEPYFSLGGIVHSYPVQLTYSGTLDANGELEVGLLLIHAETILSSAETVRDLSQTIIDLLINKETNMPVHIAESPLDCVALGAGKALDTIDKIVSNRK